MIQIKDKDIKKFLFLRIRILKILKIREVDLAPHRALKEIFLKKVAQTFRSNQFSFKLEKSNQNDKGLKKFHKRLDSYHLPRILGKN